jgi:choline dehydrogenase
LSLGTFDYIVVGAGTAGCLLANRLSADKSRRVLLLEAGGSDDYIWVRIPVGYLYCIGNPRTDWMFTTESEPGLNGRKIRYPRGKVLGGCSSINGMIYMRGQAMDYDGWEALGNAGWSWADVLPYFMRHEDHQMAQAGADPAFLEMHGSGGEWRVERQRVSWRVLDAWRAAAYEAGIPSVDDFNSGNNFGCSYFDVNQKAGVRWNAARAFLEPAKERSNLTVVSQAIVSELVFAEAPAADGRPLACGVIYRVGDDFHDAMLTTDRAAEIVLAAGGIGTPQVLERSGIGRGDVLSSLGITTRVAERGVGENLQDHLQLRTVYKVSGVPTLNTMANSWLGKARIGLEYALFKTGPMTMSPSQLGAFAKSDPSQLRPNIQYHVQPLSLDKFGEPLHRFPAITASVCHLRPFSRGSTHIRSREVTADPSIAPNYLSDQRDLAVAADALRVTRQIMAGQALAPFSPAEYLPGPQLQSQEQLEQAAREIGTTIFHPVGTAKMGPITDRNAVVDSQLRMHRVAGVRIADASVMPLITSGNTNSPTLMIAERAAEWILAGR